MKPAQPKPHILRRRLLLILFGTTVGLVGAEAVLQILGVEVRTSRLDRDPVLGWRNRPGWRGPVFSINSRGFLGAEFAAQKPPGTARIVCLGDSCTAGDLLPSFDDTYPRQLEQMLTKAHPTRPVEVINAGVGGYSSYQGRLWLEREILRYEPDLVAIYFGWNDHWPARLAGSDKEASGSRSDRLRAWLSWCKLLQLGIKAYHAVRGTDLLPTTEGGAPGGERSGRPPRVSEEDYAANLRAMVRAIKARGGEAVLVTAPNYLELVPSDRRPIPQGFSGDAEVESLIELHWEYNDMARRVAHEEGACLVDLVTDFVHVPRPAALFWAPPNDFIHLSREGYWRLAHAIGTGPAMARAMQKAAARR